MTRAAGGAAMRLLLVEDDALTSLGMSHRLRLSGFSVDTVGDGEGALAMVSQGRHDIMILDVGLPGMDGLSVLEAVRRAPGAPAVILMSGYLDVSRTLMALELGADEILEKPVEPSRLVEIVESVAARRSAARSQLRVGGGSPGETLVPELVGTSPQAQLLREQVVEASRFPDLPVMIMGETGTGKELVARAVSRLTTSDGKLTSINCAAQPEELWESELFGHEAGSFTGARGGRVGLLEAARAGTVFLDEIGEMPPSQQAKLLRVVESRSFRRVGSNEEIPLLARIVSATNRPLRGRAGEALRSDLFFRLAGYSIRTPSLRERMQDVESLATAFLTEFAAQYPGAPERLSPRAIDALHAYDWPGNVRELRSMIQLAAVRASAEDALGVRHVVEAMRTRNCIVETRPTHPSVAPSYPPLTSSVPPQSVFASSIPPRSGRRSSAPPSLREMERAHVERAYRESGRNISVAARVLGVPRTTLRDKLARYGLR